jgi:hypothetical protein
MSHVNWSLRRICISLLLDVMLYIFLLPIKYKSAIYSNVSLLIICLDDLSIVENRVMKSPAIILFLYISPSNSVNFYFVLLGYLMFHVYIFMIVISPWGIDSFFHYVVILFVYCTGIHWTCTRSDIVQQHTLSFIYDLLEISISIPFLSAYMCA